MNIIFVAVKEKANGVLSRWGGIYAALFKLNAMIHHSQNIIILKNRKHIRPDSLTILTGTFDYSVKCYGYSPSFSPLEIHGYIGSLKAFLIIAHHYFDSHCAAIAVNSLAFLT